jgi:hypothetical protein
MDVEEKIEVRRSKRPAETKTCRRRGPVEELQVEEKRHLSTPDPS